MLCKARKRLCGIMLFMAPINLNNKEYINPINRTKVKINNRTAVVSKRARNHLKTALPFVFVVKAIL